MVVEKMELESGVRHKKVYQMILQHLGKVWIHLTTKQCQEKKNLKMDKNYLQKDTTGTVEEYAKHEVVRHFRLPTSSCKFTCSNYTGSGHSSVRQF